MRRRRKSMVGNIAPKGQIIFDYFFLNQHLAPLGAKCKDGQIGY
jgi:hypothetical protein